MISFTRANPDTAQTNGAYIAAVSGQRLMVKHIYVSSDTAMTVTLVNSVTHSVIWRQYIGANGGAIWDFSDAPLRTIPGEGLDLTTSANGNVFVLVGWDRTYYR